MFHTQLVITFLMFRSQSRAGTLSSRRSSAASRRGHEAAWRKEERVEDKVARMMSPPANQRPRLDSLTNQKQRLPPLIELIEPTPPLCRSAPIFGLTGLDDAEFDLDNVSDDFNSDMSEDPLRGSEKRNEGFRIKYFYDTEQKRSKNKLINNVNTYL